MRGIGAWHDRLLAGSAKAASSYRRHLYRSASPRRGRSVGWPASHYALAARAETAEPISEGEDRSRSDLHERRVEWTTAGGAACLDLGLALIENDLGAELARSVARELIIYHRRGGGQSQFSALLEMSPKSDPIQMALTYARENLHKPLTVPELAEAARLSPRQFSRAFQAETGQSPAKAIEHLRVEAARILMEQSRHPIDVVARQSGFSDRDHMRRAFVRAFGQPPQALRRMARAP